MVSKQGSLLCSIKGEWNTSVAKESGSPKFSSTFIQISSFQISDLIPFHQGLYFSIEDFDETMISSSL